jgi:anti-sigma regulatory factor (Ser/Thr protein kinase)
MSGESGAVRVAVRSGGQHAAESLVPIPVSASVPDHTILASQLTMPHLELSASPAAVPCARHHVRQVLRQAGLTELIGPAELAASEIVTNAVRAAGGLEAHCSAASDAADALVRLWLTAGEHGALLLVWDASPSRPQPQSPDHDAESGRGLLLVEAVSTAWGSFEVAGQPGKVVWALCQK